MSRSRLPGRARALALAFAALVCLDVQDAAAQSGNPSRGAGTVMGAGGARACSNYAASGIDSEQALEVCTEALRTESLDRSNEIATLLNRGVIHLRRREGDAALADFDAAIAEDGDNAEAHLNRGGALLMLRQDGPAVAAFTEALSLGVREPHKAYFNRGRAREALDDLRGAYEDYSTALEIQPDWGPANAEIARFARNRRERLATILSEEAPEAP